MKHWPTVLLVEDDPNDALLFQVALRENSIPVNLQQVSDGHAAVDYLKGENIFSDRKTYPLPGIVVLDLHMPGFGGLALLRWIRKQRWLNGLPVVVFSGSDYGNSVSEAMQSGADTYMVKGHDTDGLVRLLENADLNWAAATRTPKDAWS
jgi:DNA-binding response OmpR family regulator